MKKMLLRRALAVVAAIFMLNLAAYAFYWYSSVSWYDMVMHTLGGIFLGLALAGLLCNKITRTNLLALAVLIGVFIVGLGWEIFEYTVQAIIKNVVLANIPDSISDLFCDMFGGIISIIFVLQAKKRYNTINGSKTTHA